jgi:hypothetical protein
MFLCCSQNENSVSRRFLKSLKESIEGSLRQHMNLIDDEHTVFPNLRRNLHLVHQYLDILDTIVRSRIKLVNAVRASLLERKARLAFATRLHILGRIGTIYGLGKNPCSTRFAYSPWAAKQVCMGQLASDN